MEIIDIWSSATLELSEFQKGYQNGIRMESEHQKTYDLIPHMTYFH